MGYCGFYGDHGVSDIDKLLGETIRVWDAQHDATFVEGPCVGVSVGRVVFVQTSCECGNRKIVAHPGSLPIDVLRWVPTGSRRPE